MEISTNIFGKLSDGSQVDYYLLRNTETKYQVTFITYGATLISFQMPDSDGVLEEINLGFSDLEGYEKKNRFYGSTVGRVANRIAKGRFTLNEKEYNLDQNNGPNCLHGGLKGFDKVVWEAQTINSSDDQIGVKFKYFSPDMENGFPGNVTVEVQYILTKDNQLIMDFQAKTDQDTPLNLTNHAYWNLSGNFKSTIKDQYLALNCPNYLPLGDYQIPTGEIIPVKGTPFDFTNETRIGDQIYDIEGGGQPGVDHCFVVEQKAEINHFGTLRDLKSGRVMEVYGTQPGIQIYTANFLTGEAPFIQHNAICMETEYFPDTINQPQFGSIVVKAGELYRHKTIHKYYVKKNE